MNPRQSYVLCTTPRSGSNFICEVLASTGIAGHPQEYFYKPAYWSGQWGVPDARSYLNRVVHEGTTANGVFGVKLMNYHLAMFAHIFREAYEDAVQLPLADQLSAFLPHVRYIWLTRRDKVLQAISLLRAEQTGMWRSTDEPTGTAVMDYRRVDRYVDSIVLGERAWQDLFTAANIQPLTIVYEDFIPDPRRGALEILRYLEIDLPAKLSFSDWQLGKQRGAQSDEWAQEYRERKERDLTRPSSSIIHRSLRRLYDRSLAASVLVHPYRRR